MLRIQSNLARHVVVLHRDDRLVQTYGIRSTNQLQKQSQRPNNLYFELQRRMQCTHTYMHLPHTYDSRAGVFGRRVAGIE